MTLCRRRHLLLALVFVLLRVKACPRDCSQHGECSGPGENGYCKCEPGYTGDGCEIRLCPKGDDPLTTGQNSREILFGWDSLSGNLGGTISLSFLGEIVSLSANAKTLGNHDCSALISSMPVVERAVCQRLTPITDSGGANYSITFEQWPTFPYENNLYPNDGRAPLEAFSCDVSRVTTGPVDEDGRPLDPEPSRPFCFFADIVKNNLKEYVECSNHGVCDRLTGNCACELGFHGPSCDDITDARDEAVVTADGPFFTGSIVKLSSRRAASPNFNILTAQVGGREALSIQGNGDVSLKMGSLHIEEGGQVVEGGVLIGSGGLEILEDGIDVASSRPGVVSSVEASREAFTGDVMVLRTPLTTPSDAFRFMRAYANKTQVMEITGTGRMGLMGGLGVHGGGLTVTGGQSALLDGAHVEGGLQVGGGLAMAGALQVSAGSRREPVVSIMAESGGSTDRQGTVLMASVDQEPLLDVATSGRLTVHQGGVEVAGGGIVINSGGQQILSGGLTVHGGIELQSGSLSLAGEGFDVEDGGLRVTDSSEAGPALRARSVSPAFSGPLLSLEVPEQSSATSLFSFVRCEGPNNTRPLDVLGDGTIISAAGVHAAGASKLGDVTIGSRASLQKRSLAAGKTIELPGDASFVEIEDDGADAENRLVLPAGANTGQLMFVSNRDAQSTSGAAVIPPDRTFLFIHDGHEWRDLIVKEATSLDLKGVRQLEAADNLDIGDYSLAARSLIATGQGNGRVAFFGPKGLVSGSDDLLVNEGILIAAKARVSEMAGPVDFKGHTLKNAVIESARIAGLSSFRTDRLYLTESERGAVAVSGAKGELVFPSKLRFEDETLSVPTLRAGRLDVEEDVGFARVTVSALDGSIDCSRAVLSGARVQGGSIERMESIGAGHVEATTLKVLSLAAKGMANAVTDALKIATVGPSGEVGAWGHLTYEPSTGTLRADKLEVNEIKDLVDMLRPDELFVDSTLTNVTISGGRLEGISVLTVDSIGIHGAAVIDGEAFIQGSLTVSGTVMGSGPYVDTSDGRLKEDVKPIEDALRVISELQGVTYRFKEEHMLRRRLQPGVQSGFIAQQVERVLPDAVHTDTDGIKYVAYGRVVPVLVEGIKELWSRLQILEDSRRIAVEQRLHAAERVRQMGREEGAHASERGNAHTRLETLEKENGLLRERLSAQEDRIKAIEAMLKRPQHA